MPALGKYLIQYFPVFLLGAIFGKLMDDSGSARVIAHWIVEHTARSVPSSWPAPPRSRRAALMRCPTTAPSSTLLSICGLTHRQSYLDIFMVAVVVPVASIVAVVLIGSTVGSF